MEDKLLQISATFLEKIQNAQTLKDLDEIFLGLFSKTGEITLFSKNFSSLPKEEIKVIAPLFSKTKKELEVAIENKRTEIKEEGYQKLEQEPLELGSLEIKKRAGHLHPLTQFEQEIVEIFSNLGFQQFDAPLVDTDHNNFEVLNIPEEHPARDLWDTLYIDKSNIPTVSETLLLRTHTSNSQIKAMKSLPLPIRVMVLGNCFRYENLDARHEHTFEQFELIYIDKGLSMANLQYLSEQFFQALFGKDIKVRLRPKYYPFVEPGVGVDAQCIFCKGQGCKVCGDGWFELAGAGMMHPTVLKNGGINPEEYSGIAWGVGPERMMMLRYGIEDIRLFRSGNLDFLDNFKPEDKKA